MESRRQFLRTSAAAMAASKSVLGANDRVQLGVIGVGTRGTADMGRFVQNQDCAVVAVCDVAKSRVETAAKTIGGSVASFGDYRRVLDRKDIDAVLIATPDHWHSPIAVDAMAAGKDIYVEKPLSNAVPAAQRMLDASRKYQRIVQVGTQQRSWPHFQECAKMIQEGVIGPVTHAVIFFGGGYYQAPQPPSDPPADLDWDAWQGPAPRHPYTPARQRNWRGFYDYGGGLITDWGVHLVDTARAVLDPGGANAPLLSSASAQYLNVENPDHEQVPNAFICSWQYKNFLISFTNTVPPDPDLCVAGAEPFFGTDAQGGDYFYGSRGVLLVNRRGYRLTMRSGGRGGRGGGGAAAPQPAPVATTQPTKFDDHVEEGSPRHVRNFLDCVKSRQKTVCDMETGFYSTLPLLLALLAIQQGRSFGWDANGMKPV
ncbi:MAG: Gfo/Idh/MocA family oxidoreductase [Bryobacteraceae bacterium]|jgi:predicted dehydrogenase